MNLKKLLLIYLLVLMSFTSKAQVDEMKKFKMFCSALDNFSTAPNYIVVKVKNKKTGELKEVCTESLFFLGAIYKETGNMEVNCKNYRERYFEFSKDSALSDIDFNLYSKSELDKYSHSINLDEIVKQVKSGKLTSKTFMGNPKEQIMFAHLMFNNGVMVKRGCLAGNICGLSFFR